MLCAHMFLPIAKYNKHCQVGIDSLYNLTLLVKVVIPCFKIVKYKDKWMIWNKFIINKDKGMTWNKCIINKDKWMKWNRCIIDKDKWMIWNKCIINKDKWIIWNKCIIDKDKWMISNKCIINKDIIHIYMDWFKNDKPCKYLNNSA